MMLKLLFALSSILLLIDRSHRIWIKILPVWHLTHLLLILLHLRPIHFSIHSTLHLLLHLHLSIVYDLSDIHLLVSIGNTLHVHHLLLLLLIHHFLVFLLLLLSLALSGSSVSVFLLSFLLLFTHIFKL